METTRIRSLPFIRGKTSRNTYRNSNGELVQSLESPFNLTGQQVTVSEGHPWKGSRSSTPRDLGGPFKTAKFEFEHLFGPKDHEFRYNNGVNTSVLSTPLLTRSLNRTDGNVGNFPRGDVISDADLLALGTSAIAKTIPLAPEATVSIALGELIKDGLPSKIGNQIRNGKSLSQGGSSEFLNYQFGILPLISDIRSVARSVSHSESILKQLKRDNGRQVRRRYSFPPLTSTSTSTTTGVRPSGVSATYSSPGTLHTEKRVQRFVWFSGAYSYFYNVDDSLVSRFSNYRRQANSLLGINFNADTIWNLMPWSWLVDWEFNVGDVLRNISYLGQDGLVLKYGYIMATDVTTYTDTLSGVRPVGSSTPLPDIVQRYTHVSKRRLKATPYGFGLNPSSFSAKQWAILAALGLSRGPSQL